MVQEVAGAVEQRIHLQANLDAAYRGSGVAGMAELEGLDCGFGEERDLVDLFDVVVFGGEPEDGDVVDAGGGGCLLGAGDGCGYFEEGEERAAKETDLLAGDDGAGAGAEFGDVGEGCGAGGEGEGLAGEGVGKGGGMSSSRCRLHPRSAERLRAVPGAQLGRCAGWRLRRGAVAHREVVAIEAGDVRQSRDWITLSGHQTPRNPILPRSQMLTCLLDAAVRGPDAG
jgi:hypothetical protein